MSDECPLDIGERVKDEAMSLIAGAGLDWERKMAFVIDEARRVAEGRCAIAEASARKAEKFAYEVARGVNVVNRNFRRSNRKLQLENEDLRLRLERSEFNEARLIKQIGIMKIKKGGKR